MDPQKIRIDMGFETLEPIAGDVSARQYFRGMKGGRSFVIMCYPDNGAQSRDEMNTFIGLSNLLSSQGLNVPQLDVVYDEYCAASFSDLGQDSFGSVIKESPKRIDDLYYAAVESMVMMHKAEADRLPLYKDSPVYQKRRQCVDFYMAFTCGRLFSEGSVAQYLSVFDDIENQLPTPMNGFVHGDYHLENMIYAPQEVGSRRAGIIDFQDAFYGPLAYDLVNLLEDARVDVPIALRNAMMNRYFSHWDMRKAEQESFAAWYCVLGVQFHCRVLGLFIKLAVEQERDSYLCHIPRLQRYVSDALCDPILRPLKELFLNEGVDFTPLNDLDGNHIRAVFKELNQE